MPLTEEQQAVVQSRSEALKVVAFAGAGKTSTLRAYAKARPERRMLYLAFNKSIAREAASRFTPNVTCLTTHSLAYRIVGRAYRHKLVNNIRANQAAQVLGLNSCSGSDLGLGLRSLKALKHFLSTSCVDLKEFALLFPNEKTHQHDAIRGAERLWQAMCDSGNEAMPMLHDGYLKLFQLSTPRLEYDTILFDEAQDANPVTLAIVRQQSCAKVFVGDPHQQIYQFRYAENAMADPSLTDELFLTESFRFGEEIASAANRLLAVKRERNHVSGGRLVPPSSTKACIARGNAALYRRAAQVAHAGRTVCWVGGIKGYQLELLQDIWALKAGQHSEINDRFVAGFDDFDAIQDYATRQDERDLKAWIRVIEGHPRWLEIPEEIALVRSRTVTQSEKGTLALATAHKSKGLEFGSVELEEDFPEEELANPVQYNRENHPEFWDEEGFRGGVLLALEEINLRYVAITRAETSCSSGHWPAPLFHKLADYILCHPRFLTLEELLTLRCSSPPTSQPAFQALEAPALPAEINTRGMVRVWQLAKEMRLDNKKVLDAATQLGFAAKSHSSRLSDDECIFIRNLINGNEKPLEDLTDECDLEVQVHVEIDHPQPSKDDTRSLLHAPRVLDVSAVVSAYKRGYPLVCWDLLAQRWQEKGTDVQQLIIGHPLQSAHGLISEFIDALARAENDDKPPALEADESGSSISALIADNNGLRPVETEEELPPPDSWNFTALQSPTPIAKTSGFSYASKSDICHYTGKSKSDVQRAIDTLNCKEPFSRVIADRLAAILTGDPSIKRAFDRTILLDVHVNLPAQAHVVDEIGGTQDRPFPEQKGDKRRNSNVDEASRKSFLGDLGTICAQIPWIDGQLGGKAESRLLDQSEVPDESVDFWGESSALDGRSQMEANFLKLRNQRSPLRWEVQQEPYEDQEPEIETEEFLVEEQLLDQPDKPSYREWDDMDNFWNQDGVFEEMTDQYQLDEDC